jgi:hypothetical protein
MAKSAAQKKLSHSIRQNPTGFDPRLSRGSWNGVKPTPRIKQGKRKYDVCDREIDVVPFEVRKIS